MFRPLAAAAAVANLAVAGAATAQTYGQPVYLDAWGRPIGGTPLSEVETRSYVGTGRWADGYSDRPHAYVPAPGYGRSWARYGAGYRSYAHDGGVRPGYSVSRYDAHSSAGYRDTWGYNDDRPPTAWRRRSDRDPRYGQDRGCDCPDVYFYDR